MALFRFRLRQTASLLSVALALTCALFTSSALAAPTVPLTSTPPNCGSGDQASNCGEAVTYHSGLVQHHPVIYLVFWGSEWNSDPDGVIPAMQDLFTSLAGTAYNNILTQYSDSQSHVYNDVRLGGTWIDTSDSIPVTIGPTQFVNEVISVQAHKPWPGTADTQFIIFPQQGSHLDPVYDNVCGEHDYTNDAGYATAYSLVRYASDMPGCQFQNETSESMTMIAAHEYAEAATDPQGPGIITGVQQWGWATIDPESDPIEVADKCLGYNDTSSTANASDFFVNGYAPLLWDQGATSCAAMRGQDYLSPNDTAPFDGVHTVQGAILTEYMHMGQDTGMLGEPLTEEMPSANGRISYFAGQVCSGGYTIPSNTGYGGSGLTSGSAIFWISGTAHEVHGCNYHEYMSVMGGPGGKLGFPTADEQAIAGGAVATFAGTSCTTGSHQGSGSAIYYSSSTKSHEVQGCNYQEYLFMGGPGGRLGFPSTDEQTIPGGAVAFFAGTNCTSGSWQGSGSAIYFSSSTASHEVQGCIYQMYKQYTSDTGHALSSDLGFPTSDESGITSGYSGISARTNSFQHGAIFWTSARGALEVQGENYNAYLSQGGASGVMGLPISNEYTNAGGNKESDFEDGFILYIPSTGQTIVSIYPCC